MGCCCDCLQLPLHLAVLLLSGGLLGLGVTALYSDLAPLLGGGYRREALGATLAGVGGLLVWKLATCSVVKRSWKVLLAAILLLLGGFIVVETCAMAGVFGSGDLIAREITVSMNESIDNYNNDALVRDAWDFVQRKQHCCGAANASDWGRQLGTDRVPGSCCHTVGETAASNCSATEGAFTVGCATLVGDFIVEYRGWALAAAGAAAGAILLILLCGWCCGFCQKRSGPSYVRLNV